MAVGLSQRMSSLVVRVATDKSQDSVEDLLALNENGEVSMEELVGAIWAQCYDTPTLAAAGGTL
jgi:hypothetical protein